MAEYKDLFTLDGRLHPQPGVTKHKVAAVQELVEKAMAGNKVAKGTLEESFATSDALFNYIRLVNINTLAQFENEPRVWTQVAGTRIVPDFRPPTLYSLFPQFGEGTLDTQGQRHVAPVVPEGAAYPYATITGEEAVAGGVWKRGFKVSYTWEAFINDSLGFLQQLPESMRQVALDTEEAEVMNALIAGVGSGQDLAGGTTYTGATVVANAPLSRDAILRAIEELTARTVNGRRVRVTGGYNLIVPVGTGPAANFILNQTYATVQDGSYVLNVGADGVLSGINVIESEYVTGTAWYLLPRPGGFGGRPVLELLKLAGQELPELRVENIQGTYVGGGAVSPFEGSFSNDTVDIRLRHVVKGNLWSADAVVWSSGAGS